MKILRWPRFWAQLCYTRNMTNDIVKSLSSSYRRRRYIHHNMFPLSWKHDAMLLVTRSISPRDCSKSSPLGRQLPINVSQGITISRISRCNSTKTLQSIHIRPARVLNWTGHLQISEAPKMRTLSVVTLVDWPFRKVSLPFVDDGMTRGGVRYLDWSLANKSENMHVEQTATWNHFKRVSCNILECVQGGALPPRHNSRRLRIECFCIWKFDRITSDIRQ